MYPCWCTRGRVHHPGYTRLYPATAAPPRVHHGPQPAGCGQTCSPATETVHMDGSGHLKVTYTRPFCALLVDPPQIDPLRHPDTQPRGPPCQGQGGLVPLVGPFWMSSLGQSWGPPSPPARPYLGLAGSQCQAVPAWHAIAGQQQSCPAPVAAVPKSVLVAEDLGWVPSLVVGCRWQPLSATAQFTKVIYRAGESHFL